MIHRPGVDLSLGELLSMRVQAARTRPGVRTRKIDGHSVSQPVSRGLDVSEVRRYQPGDEVRLIDWKVTARRGETHVKVFEDERAFAVYLLVDLRASLHFGTRNCYKSVLAARLAAGIAWRAHYNGSRFCAWILTDAGLVRLQEASDLAALHRLCQAMVRHHAPVETSGEVQLTGILQALSRGQVAKADWHLISNFADWTPETVLPRRVSISCWHLCDPLDRELPRRGGWVRDRTGLRRLSVSRGARRDHLEQYEAMVSRLKHACFSPRHRYIPLYTSEGSVEKLRRALASGLGA